MIDARKLQKELEAAGSPQRAIEIMKKAFEDAPKLTGKLTEEDKNKDESNSDLPEIVKKQMDSEASQYKMRAPSNVPLQGTDMRYMTRDHRFIGGYHDGALTRNHLYLHSPAERAITEAIAEVERAGGSPALTDAVNLLGAARDSVSDHVERQPYLARKAVIYP